MASDIDASCENDPNFAVICAFLDKFGEKCGLPNLDFVELQEMLENSEEVHPRLLNLLLKILRKVKRSLKNDKWEKGLAQICHTFSSQDAWEIERFGYKKAKLSTKVKVLKELLEMQFDHNVKFKNDVNKLTANDLRSQPLGRDKFGHNYWWFESDKNYQIRVYKEDIDEETWSLIAKDRAGLNSLISQLSDGDYKISSDSALNEDSNSLTEKPVIDTGQKEDEEDTGIKEEIKEEEPTKPSEQKEENRTSDGEEEKEDSSKPSLRLKNINDLLETSRKRPKLEENLIDNRSLTVEITKLISKEIEDPMILIRGEGSGADNKSVFENPIVGEAIEEEVFYVHGEGSGADCQTGNNETVESKNESDSISTNLNVNKDNIEHLKKVPCKVNDKTDNNSNNTEDEVSQSALEDATNSPTASSAKGSFFFGSPKSTISSLTVGFGQNCKQNDNDSDNTKNDEKNNLDEEKEDVNKKISTVKEDLVNNTEQNQTPVNEEPCRKKIAYVCGENETDKAPEETEEAIVNEKPESTNNEQPSEGPVQEIKKSLRSVRSKKVAATPAESASKKTSKSDQENPASPKSNDVATEVVYVKGRRNRIKEKESETNLIAVKKKPKLLKDNKVEKTSEKEETNRETNDKSKTKNSKSTVNSNTSSRVSTPISVADSIITLPESVDSIEGAAAEKDPLGPSDQEEAAPKSNVMSLQSFSFDYNDSSTPPPIPVIPSTRTLRKRGRAASPPETKPVDEGEGKRRKIKGKRQIDVQLRKSIEQQKEQQVSSSDEVIDITDDKQKKGSTKKKKPSKTKTTPTPITVSDDDSRSTPTAAPKAPRPKQVTVKKVINPENKNKRLLAGMDLSQVDLNTPTIRQSRRLAQIKIKEQIEPQKPAPKETKEKIEKEKGKKKKKKDKESKEKAKENEKKKAKPEKNQDSSEPEFVKDFKKKKRKFKAPHQLFDEHRPWKSSTEESEEIEEEEEVIEEEEPPLVFKSDHEFSPESDVGSDAEDYQPPKRARTARKKVGDSDEGAKEETEEFFPCQKCGKSDHPEMVLLCDKCDNGWHCSCLRPPLLSIPEGDWFCPPCQHIKLVENLHAKLVEYDKKLIKKGLEDRRKERLAYVGISLNNVLPSREKDHRKKRRRHSHDDGDDESCSSSEESESSSSESTSSDSDEPIYQLRQRREAKSYKFNEYDELIKSAIQDDLEDRNSPKPIIKKTRGKDIATIERAAEEDRKVRALEQQQQDNTVENKEETLPSEEQLTELPTVKEAEEKVDEEKPPVEETKEEEVKSKVESDEEEEIIKPPVVRGRKKKKKTNFKSLDFSSEDDDEKDEDFRGTSSSSEEDVEEEEESDDGSEDYAIGRKGRSIRPLRRSTRTRVPRYDADFINDDDDDVPKKKKKIRYFSDSDSSESEGSWGRKKKKKSSFGKKKKKKKSILDELSDLEQKIKKRPKIKYGGLTSSDEDFGRGRRTRGKKTTYIDTLGSDSEDERRRKNKLGIISDDDDDDEDFVANEEEDKESKESEGAPDEEDDEDEDNEKAETERKAFVPKIYIKKPLGPKEMEKPKEKEKDKKEVIENSEVETKKTEENIEKANGEENNEVNVEKTDKSVVIEKLKETLEKCRAAKDINGENEKIVEKELSTSDNKAEEAENYKVQNLSTSDNEKKRKAVDGHEENSMDSLQGKRPANISHEPIVSNVSNMIKNDDSNDELSEPPMGVSLPMFEELSQKEADENQKKKKGRGRTKKTLEETLATLGNKKLSGSLDCNIEIAAPPQPFSQAAPTPSVITRMLQTKPGQTTTYPIGSIRPKQFATMVDDDDDDDVPPPRKNRERSPGLGPPPMLPGHFPSGPRGPLGLPYRAMYPNINHFPPSMLHPSHMRGPPPGMHPHSYPPHRFMDPSPSGGGPVNMSDSNSGMPPPPPGSPGNKEPQNYSRSTPPSRYPPVSNAPGPPRSPHVMTHPPPPRPPYQPPNTQQPPHHPHPSSMIPHPSQPPPHPHPSQPTPHPQPPPHPHPSQPPPHPHPSQPPPHPHPSQPPPHPHQSQPPPHPHPPQPQQSDVPSPAFYGSYQPPHREPVPPNEEIPPPAAPYHSQPPVYEPPFEGEGQPSPSRVMEEISQGGEEETGGEFGGLVSYFSSQRDEDLDS